MKTAKIKSSLNNYFCAKYHRVTVTYHWKVAVENFISNAEFFGINIETINSESELVVEFSKFNEAVLAS